ncbi:MAG: branched-chain amino acid ABC transporter substrate-binding protein [Deltaproteobacteria bacterium]|jgi:branched-chain amino acid transport system substrate-binding protein|nr:branched-chain amino acid ABC transporter substrate-binding protein [Deltaproteobacteria bacterium]
MRGLFTILAIVLLSPSGAAMAQGTLKIGFAGALLGNLSSYGSSNLYGVEFAVADVNSKGGVAGKQVELVIEDDSCDPTLATAAAAKLLSAGIGHVLGHTCSGATASALEVYGNKAIVMSSSATEVSLTESGRYPRFFRTTPRDDVQGGVILGLIKKRGFKKVAILHDGSDHGMTLAAFVENGLKSDPSVGAAVVLSEGPVSGRSSSREAAARVKNSGADALFWGGYHVDGAKLAENLGDINARVVIVGADGLFDERFIRLGGPDVEGSYVTGQAPPPESPAAGEALEYHRKNRAEESGTYFFHAAGAAQALFSAIGKAGDPSDPELVKRHLTEDTVPTVMGPVRFDSKGDIIGGAFNLYRVKNGKFLEVSP